MDDSLPIAIASGVGVAIALVLVRRRSGSLQPKIRASLAEAGGSLLLPELVVKVGMKDSFLNRGKVIQAIAPLVQSGEVVEEDDPEATVKNRLERKRFRLRGA